MTQIEQHLELAAEFAPATRERWLALVRSLLLKDGADAGEEAFAAAFAAQLETRTYDGIRIHPLYTREDAPEVEALGLPGSAPFVRGSRWNGRAVAWEIRQRVAVAGSDVNARALAELERGASALLLDFHAAPEIAPEVLADALAGVDLDLAAIALDAGSRWEVAAEALSGLWRSRGGEAGSRRGALGADPIGAWAAGGGVGDLAHDLQAIATCARRCAQESPNVRAVVADGTRYHAAGASDGEEMGCALAVALEYLRALAGAALPMDVALGQVEIRLAATADQFSTIAKIRAMRRLWNRVATVAGGTPAHRAAAIHAISSTAMMTRYDPWVNLLRATVACFAAGVAGADAVTVLPYDHAVTPSGSELGRRLARNTQSILASEVHLARVVDPAGGSWYVERLSDELGRAAWGWLQEIEREGGLVAALRSGLVQERIEATRAARQRNIALRRDALTGLSEFPDIDEPPPPDAAMAELAPVASGGAGAVLALRPHRYSEEFEELRQRVDRHTARTGKRPTVFLAALGPPAIHVPRVNFAKNLFEVAGIRTLAGEGATDADAVASGFAASGSRVACLCSSDRTYAEFGVAAAAALKKAGATRVYLAGRPRDLEAALGEVGVEGYVFVGCDVLASLRSLVEELGVP